MCRDYENDELQQSLDEVENKVCDLVSENNYEKVVENFKLLGNKSGQIQQNGVWSLSRKVFPKINNPCHLKKKKLRWKSYNLTTSNEISLS